MSTYDYDWLKKNPAWTKYLDRAEKYMTTDSVREYNSEVKKLKTTIRRLQNKLVQLEDRCPHPIKEVKLDYRGRGDDYGGYVPGYDWTIVCGLCSVDLESGSEET